MFCVPFCVPKNIFFILSDLAENHIIDYFWYVESKKVGHFDPSGVVSKFPFLVREPEGSLRPSCDPFFRVSDLAANHNLG